MKQRGKLTLPFAFFPERDLIDFLLNTLFPVQCVLCEELVLERRWGAACPDCWARLKAVPEPLCPQCGMPAVAIEGLCGRCRRGESCFDFARSALLFDETARQLIHHLKYQDRVSLAGPFGAHLRSCLEREPFSGSLIIPVPLHPSRERERGFNQAELIARRLGRPVDRRILRRRKKTPTQTGLTRAQRKINLNAAFAVRGPVPEGVIVVDDVFTTGSTVNEIARTLKRAGAKRVEVLTLSRVANEVLSDGEETDNQAEVTVASETTSSRTQESLLSSKLATKRV